MYRYAVINKDGDVMNVVIWDGVTQWNPPKDHIAVREDKVDVFDKYDRATKTFTRFDKRADYESHVIPNLMKPQDQPAQIPNEDLMARIKALEDLINQNKPAA